MRLASLPRPVPQRHRPSHDTYAWGATALAGGRPEPGAAAYGRDGKAISVSGKERAHGCIRSA